MRDCHWNGLLGALCYGIKIDIEAKKKVDWTCANWKFVWCFAANKIKRSEWTNWKVSEVGRIKRKYSIRATE